MDQQPARKVSKRIFIFQNFAFSRTFSQQIHIVPLLRPIFCMLTFCMQHFAQILRKCKDVSNLQKSCQILRTISRHFWNSRNYSFSKMKNSFASLVRMPQRRGGGESTAPRRGLAAYEGSPRARIRGLWIPPLAAMRCEPDYRIRSVCFRPYRQSSVCSSVLACTNSAECSFCP